MMNDRTAAPDATDRSRSVLNSPGTPWRPWLLPGALLVFLAALTAGVQAGGPLISLDEHIRAAVLARATTPGWHWLIEYRLSPARVLVNLGDTRIAVPVLLLVAFTLSGRRRSLRPLAAAVIAVILLLVTVIPAKIIIARPSPGLGPVATGGWGAFPSGHTTTGSVCFVLAALLIAGGTRRVRWAAGAAMALSFLIGIALVWRDFHWFTDVVAGWALAALIVLAALWLAGPGLTGLRLAALQVAIRLRPPRATGSGPERVPDPQKSAIAG
jgi:membrane-associated phospholipid phosphatase